MLTDTLSSGSMMSLYTTSCPPTDTSCHAQQCAVEQLMDMVHFVNTCWSLSVALRPGHVLAQACSSGLPNSYTYVIQRIAGHTADCRGLSFQLDHLPAKWVQELVGIALIVDWHKSALLCAPPWNLPVSI